MHRLIFNFHKWIFPVKLTAFASTPCSKKLGETFFFLKFYVKYASYGQHDDDDDDDDDDDEFFCGMVDQRKAALFPARTIVRDSHHHKSPIHRKQDCLSSYSSISSTFFPGMGH